MAFIYPGYIQYLPFHFKEGSLEEISVSFQAGDTFIMGSAPQESFIDGVNLAYADIQAAVDNGSGSYGPYESDMDTALAQLQSADPSNVRRLKLQVKPSVASGWIDGFFGLQYESLLAVQYTDSGVNEAWGTFDLFDDNPYNGGTSLLSAPITPTVVSGLKYFLIPKNLIEDGETYYYQFIPDNSNQKQTNLVDANDLLTVNQYVQGEIGSVNATIPRYDQPLYKFRVRVRSPQHEYIRTWGGPSDVAVEVTADTLHTPPSGMGTETVGNGSGYYGGNEDNFAVFLHDVFYDTVANQMANNAQMSDIFYQVTSPNCPVQRINGSVITNDNGEAEYASTITSLTYNGSYVAGFSPSETASLQLLSHANIDWKDWEEIGQNTARALDTNPDKVLELQVVYRDSFRVVGLAGQKLTAGSVIVGIYGGVGLSSPFNSFQYGSDLLTDPTIDTPDADLGNVVYSPSGSLSNLSQLGYHDCDVFATILGLNSAVTVASKPTGVDENGQPYGVYVNELNPITLQVPTGSYRRFYTAATLVPPCELSPAESRAGNIGLALSPIGVRFNTSSRSNAQLFDFSKMAKADEYGQEAKWKEQVKFLALSQVENWTVQKIREEIEAGNNDWSYLNDKYKIDCGDIKGYCSGANIRDRIKDLPINWDK